MDKLCIGLHFSDSSTVIALVPVIGGVVETMCLGGQGQIQEVVKLPYFVKVFCSLMKYINCCI